MNSFALIAVLFSNGLVSSHFNQVSLPLAVYRSIVFAKLFYEMIIIMSLMALKSNFGLLPGIRGITTSGPYTLMRHPIYSGALHIQAILLLPFLSLEQVGLTVVTYLGIWVRIFEEEKTLALVPEYQTYQKQVPRRVSTFLFSVPALLTVGFEICSRFIWT